jgi:hypothetical protein
MRTRSLSLAVVAIMAIHLPMAAQTVHQLPFSSSGNTIELTIANTSSIALSGVQIEATSVPSWLSFKEIKQSLSVLKANQELPLLFTFSVDKLAPVNKEQLITFAITSSAGEKWTKQIKIRVSPPDHFELFQNYPNPFNPTTAISYQLSEDSRVSLKVYNMLGQEVASLVDEERAAGYHQERWDATRSASGVYVYQLIATDEHGTRQIARKRMLLLK